MLDHFPREMSGSQAIFGGPDINFPKLREER